MTVTHNAGAHQDAHYIGGVKRGKGCLAKCRAQSSEVKVLLDDDVYIGFHSFDIDIVIVSIAADSGAIHSSQQVVCGVHHHQSGLPCLLFLQIVRELSDRLAW